MPHKFNPGFDDWAFYSHDDDGPCPSPTMVGGWPEREYHEPDHVCVAVTTPNGHGAYCAECGETLA